MKMRKILSFTLALTMLLSLFSGMSFANAAAPRMVPVGEESAYDPLAETASIAYEQHEDGYAVTLDRAADSVTMHLTAVPDSGRKAEGARLYIRTGTALKAGTAYRVSFALWSEKALSEYAVCLDGGDTASAYGKLEKRSIEAGGTDRVEYLVTPEKESGELVLRLLLGNAEAGALRFSGLAVEESSAEAMGKNVMLVDKLNYNAPGSVTIWTNDDYSAALTTSGESATMTMTEVPKTGKAVWKAKLLVATGLKPETGKTYRFTADVEASASRSYELCYNEGDVEKGYAVLYNQTLKVGTQKLERLIYIPNDKENAGELIVQLSLGNLSVGDQVTIRNISVVEAIPTYTSVLPGNYSFKADFGTDVVYGDNYNVWADTPVQSEIDWGGVCVTATGNRKGALTVDKTNKKATLAINKNTDDNDGVWEAKLNIDTGLQLTAASIYRVSFGISAQNAYGEYEVLYGTAIEGVDNNKTYGGLYRQAHTGGDAVNTVTYLLKPTSDSGLIITLQLGKTGGVDNIVTVKNLTIEKLTTSDVEENQLQYSTIGDHFSVRATTYGGNITSAAGSAVTMNCTGGNSGDYWKRGLFTGPVCDLTDGKTYTVSFHVTASDNIPFEACYSIGNDNWDGEGDFGFERGMTATTSDLTVTHTYTAPRNGTLRLRLDLGRAEHDRTITISNISVHNDTTNEVVITTGLEYSTSSGHFDVRATTYGGNITSATGSAVTMRCTGGNSGGYWQRGLFTGGIGWLANNTDASKPYLVSFDITSTKDLSYEVAYNKQKDWDSGYEKGYGSLSGLMAYANQTHTVIYQLMASGQENLRMRFDLGRAENDTDVTISNIHLWRISDPGTNLTGDFGSSIWAEMDGSYKGVLTRDGSGSATLDVTDAPAGGGTVANKVKLHIRTGLPATEGVGYMVSYTITATNSQSSFDTIYLNGRYEDSYDWNANNFGGEYGVSLSAGVPRTLTHKVAASPSANGGVVTLQLELGKVPAGGNTFTISNVTVTQGTASPAPEIAVTHNAVSYDMQSGYRGKLDLTKEQATLNILETPSSRMEAWRSKLFVEPNVSVYKGETVRVTFDMVAEQDMDFEVCYNQNQTEKGFDAIYGLHASGGKTKTIERLFTSAVSGRLIIQLSLGNVPAPNKVTIRNLKVEKVTYRDGDSALPAPLIYRAGGAVSYWAHNDYNANLTGSDDAITMNIVKPAANNPEPWKIKLFLDTGAVLEPGKFYKVTADLSAKMSQSFEIAYNNGGAESGYDFFGGLRVNGGGETQTVEKLISVPADKTDAKNLMLQFNLGKTASPNAVTISNVTVEEVALSYAGIMKGFSYQKSLSTWTDPKTSYKAALDSTDSSGTIHITDVPSSGTGVWMTKLFVRTGAMLQAGKSYQVRANLLAARAQDFEVCYNNEETEKGFDALYGQKLAAGVKTTVDKKITVPASMTDAGELVIQFSVGGAVANDITVSDVSVQEIRYGSSAGAAPDTVIGLRQSAQAAGTLDVSREKLSYHMTKSAADGNAITMAGANLRAGDRYAVAFTAKADKAMNGTLTLAQAGGKSTVISQQFALTTEPQQYSFTTADGLPEGGFYDILWQFGSAEKTPANVELSDITVFAPSERLEIMPSGQRVTVNGVEVKPDAYNINGSNYFKLRDLAMLLRGTDGQFVVRYNGQTGLVSLTTGKEYTPVGGELKVGTDKSTTCVRSPQNVSINGKEVKLKAYNIGGNNFFKLRDLGKLLNFQVDYIAATNTAVIASPLTPERQEAAYAYDMFFRPEIDGESQPFVGDTMPYYEDGTYYIYYLKEGGDSYNHSVYLTTTKDFVNYTERPTPVLDASRADVQDSWIGTGSVMKADNTYYFFYTGFNASGSQEYHEKIMVAKGTSPTDFTKVAGWSITPPAELNQKNDFRDPQAYYDPATGTISLTVTASKNGAASILKYTLDKDLTNVTYDGVIFTDPTGAFWNLECSDTFQIGNKWYLTYSGQEDAVWYATADSRFGPYSAPERMDGKLFYAGKHVEDGKNSYMIGWTRRSETASSTEEVSGWGGNLTVQKLSQQKDGSLSLVPVDSIASAFKQQKQLSTDTVTLTAGSDKSYKQAFTGEESYLLSGEFTYSGSGSFGLAFDFSGKEEQYKLVSVDPAEGKLKLSFNNGVTPIAETKATLAANQKHTFTYIQDGSVGIFYLDGQAALTVRLYGTTGKPIYLFAENNSVTFASLRQFAR